MYGLGFAWHHYSLWIGFHEAREGQRVNKKTNLHTVCYYVRVYYYMRLMSPGLTIEIV